MSKLSVRITSSRMLRFTSFALHIRSSGFSCTCSLLFVFIIYLGFRSPTGVFFYQLGVFELQFWVPVFVSGLASLDLLIWNRQWSETLRWILVLGRHFSPFHIPPILSMWNRSLIPFLCIIPMPGLDNYVSVEFIVDFNSCCVIWLWSSSAFKNWIYVILIQIACLRSYLNPIRSHIV